jgi:hypothetical protein
LVLIQLQADIQKMIGCFAMSNLMQGLTSRNISVASVAKKSCDVSKNSPNDSTDITYYKQASNETVTPILFEFGVNKNAHNKQAIGGYEALTINWKNKRGTIGDLIDWVSSGKAIMVGTLPNATTRRLKSNVVSAQAIALDIDDGLSIEDCLQVPFVRDYAAAIYTSASHQKVKGDIPACDRYRIIFVLPETVTDIALYEATVQVVMEAVGYADKACKDASRMFYGYDKTEIVLCDPTKVLPTDFLEKVGDRLEQEKAERARLFEERQRRREEYGESDDLDNLIPQALDFIDPDCGYEEWRNVGMALHSHSESNFYLWDSWSSRGSKYKGSRGLERQWSKFKSGGGVGIGSLFHIAKDYGFKFPEKSYHRGSGRKGDRLTDSTTWGKTQASKFIQWLNEKAQKAAPTFKKLLKVAQNPITEPPAVIRWQNGDPVPTREDYGDRPIPKIIYARGSNPFELLAGLRSAGWRSALDSGITGDGKTYRAGMVKFDSMTGWYIDENHNNPSVENVERNYTNLWARHNGLWRDEFGNLTRKGTGKPEIEGNCPSADLFPALAAKGYDAMASKDNPICGVCDRRGYCHTDAKQFKFQRGNALAAQQIRADIQSLPNPLEYDYSNNYAIIEEATTQARKALSEVSGDWGDLLQNFDDVEKNAPETYEQLNPLREALRAIFEAPQGRYGLEHEAIFEMLPTPPANIEELLDSVLLAIAPEVDLEEADRVSGAGKQFAHLQKQTNRDLRYQAKGINEERLLALPNNLLLPLLRVWSGDRGSIRLEHKQLTITQPNTRKQQTVQAFGFRLLLDATGNKKAIAAGFGLAENSIIEIQQELPALDNLTVYQTNMSGIKSNKRSDSKRKDDSELKDPKSRKKSKTAKERIAAYKQAWREIDPNVEFLGFKGEDEIAGWWFNHNRGSNKFKGRLSLVSFGLPYPHIGAIKAEYRALFGTLDGFDDYYRRLVEDEVIQFVGRQRVQHYPDQKFVLDIVATYGENFDLSFLNERYGIKVIEREAVEFCLEAGTTQEQIKQRIFDIAKGITAAGEKLTQQAIATATGLSQQMIHKHLDALFGGWFEFQKVLQPYLKETYSDGCKNPESSPPIEPILAAATLIDLFSQGGWESLRAFLEDLPPPEARYWLGCLLRTAAIA